MSQKAKSDLRTASARSLVTAGELGCVPPPSGASVAGTRRTSAVASEAGRLGLAVHLHTGIGAGSYFEIAGSNPLLLETVLNDKTLRKTNFVLVHGGWPFTKEVAGLFARPNVYADFSAQAFFLSPAELSDVLRNWLTMFPEKILFGTDTFATSFEIGWEEIGWLTAKTGREALAIALTKMIAEGQLTRTQALELAGSVLRDNAIKLYRFQNKRTSNERK